MKEKSIPVSKIKELIAGYEYDIDDWYKESEKDTDTYSVAEAVSAAKTYDRVVSQLEELIKEAKAC